MFPFTSISLHFNFNSFFLFLFLFTFTFFSSFTSVQPASYDVMGGPPDQRHGRR